MWVVKLGGSLAKSDTLRDWLAVLTGPRTRPLVVAPGGGFFADHVREAQRAWRFDDAVAHRMAILAVEQYGLLLAGLEPRLVPAETVAAIRRTQRRGGVPVWLPDRMTRGRKDIPAHWGFTSDSLAAWLARHVRAEDLVLVKSFEPPPGEVSAEDLCREGTVDAAFPAMMARMDARVWCVGPSGQAAMAEALCGDGDGPGTRMWPHAAYPKVGAGGR